MKKTLIALALTALPVASMAEVVLYGQIKGGVEVTKTKGEHGTTTEIVDYGSRIGFKGEESLTGDLKAIWQLESSVNIGGGEAGFGTRDSFIGLKGNFGTVKAGYQETPTARLNGELDVWEYSAGAAGLGVFTRDNDATGRRLALSYETPNFNGLSAQVYVAPSDNQQADTLAVKNSNTDSALYGLSASYRPDNGLFADLAVVYVRNGSNNEYSNLDGYQGLAQVGYDNDQFLVGLAYQYTRGVDGASDVFTNSSANLGLDGLKSGHEVAITGVYKVDSALNLKASLAGGFGFKDYDNDKVLGNGKYYQGIVGADYALSKRTIVNGQVGYFTSGKKDERYASGTVSVGMVHKF